jgi:hypothetical protein
MTRVRRKNSNKKQICPFPVDKLFGETKNRKKKRSLTAYRRSSENAEKERSTEALSPTIIMIKVKDKNQQEIAHKHTFKKKFAKNLRD